MLIFCSVVLTVIITYTDGRVLCGDTNASPWIALGYSCPINCFNVLYAAERLKIMDYKHFLSEEVGTKTDLSSSERITNSIEALQIQQTYNWKNDNRGRRGLPGGKYGKFKQIYAECEKLLKNKNIISDLEAHLKKQSPKCPTLLKKASMKPLLFKKVLLKCSRRSNVEEEFMNTLTDILNKHIKKYTFTVYMTKILLQKILGHNMDLRNGVFDIKKILDHLKSAIDRQKVYTDGTIPTVHLQSKHCLNMYVTGCFCRTGYVEMSGRCVTPANCTLDETLMKYLTRIIVH